MSDDRQNQQIQLAARPVGEIKPTDFNLVDVPTPEIGDGEVLVESRYLAVEPAMKGWMEARVDYTAPINIGDPMRGWGTGVVVASNNPRSTRRHSIRRSMARQSKPNGWKGTTSLSIWWTTTLLGRNSAGP